MTSGQLSRVGTGILAVLALSLAPRVCAAGKPNVHDGFYLRLGGGAGWIHDSGEVDEQLGIRVQGAVTGWTLVGDLAVGGALSPGFFLGGAFFGQYLPHPRADGAEFSSHTSFGTLTGEINAAFDPSTLLLIGPFVDYYLAPEGGFHLLGSIGLAYGALGGANIPVAGESLVVPSQSGGGWGGLAGLGYDFWVASEWSLGVFGQLGLASIAATDANDNSSSHLIAAPSLLVTAAMN